MATQEVQIAGTQEVGKVRDPVTTLLLYLFVPFYSLFWYFAINKELAAIGQARGSEEAGTDPTKSLLAMVPGGFIVVPAVISWWNCMKRIHAAERLTHGQPQHEPLIMFLLTLIPIYGIYLILTKMGAVMQAQAGAPQQAAPQPA